MGKTTEVYTPLLPKHKIEFRFAKTVIAVRCEDCTQGFTRLCDSLGSRFPEQTTVGLVDCLARFISWANETGAKDKELDYNLRNAPDMHDLVAELLEQLQSLIDDAIQVLEMDGVERSGRATPDGSNNMAEEEISPDKITSSETIQSGEDNLGVNQHILDISEYIQETVDNLNALKLSLGRPWRQDVELYSSSNANEMPAGDHTDLDLAKQLFPHASKILQSRLSYANYRRKASQKTAQMRIQQMGSASKKKRPKATRAAGRQDIATDAFNFQKPTLKMTKAQENAHRGSPSRIHSFREPSFRGTAQTTAGSRPVFTLTPIPDRTLQAESDSDSDIGSSSMFSKPTLSRNESHTTLTTISSRFNKSVKGASTLIHTPPLSPVAVEFPKIPLDLGTIQTGTTEFFTCNLCGHDLEAGNSIKTEKDWENHVFQDLEPYLCTFDECRSAQELYAIQEEWYKHELETHRIRKVWLCSACMEEFPTKDLVESHLEDHLGDLDEQDIFMLKQILRQTMSKATLETQDCPLCLDRLRPSETKAHIARHLELFALMSVHETESSEDGMDETFSQTDDDLMSERGRREMVLNNFVQEQFNLNRERYPPDRDMEGGTGLDLLEDMSDYDGSKDSDSRVGSNRKEPENIMINRMFQSHNLREKGKTEGATKYPPRDLAGPPSLVSSNERLPLLRTGTNPRNEDFMGREKDLASLYKILSEPGRVSVVSGEGGMGKTSLAVEFTWRYEHHYHYIFWVQAETPVGSSDTFCQIAMQLGLSPDVTDTDTMIRLGREFLETTKDKRWLLVFDNVEKWEDIDVYTPTKTSATNGSILITTRYDSLTAPSRPVNYFRIALQELDIDEGRRLLIHSLPQDLRPVESSLRDPDYKIAGEIAALAGLPLLIVYISGYIKASNCTLSEFWEYWEDWRPKRLLGGAAASKTDASERESVFNIALRDLGPDAFKILKIMALFNSDGIQRELLVRNDNNKPGPNYLRVARFRTIISALVSQKFVSESKNKQDGRETYTIHRVLQARLLKDMSKQAERDEIFRIAFDLVRYHLPRPSLDTPEPAQWNVFKEYLPHVLSLQRAYADPLSITTPEPFVGLAELFKDGGVLLWQRYIYHDALKLLRSAENVLNKLGSAEEDLRADINITLNLLLQYFGISHRKESRERVSKILEYRRSMVDKKDPKEVAREDEVMLNDALADYGNALLQFNDYTTAEPIYQKCYNKYLELGNDADPTDTFALAKLNHHIAYCKMYLGQFGKAIELSEKAVAIVNRLGDKQMALRYQFDLACIILQSGNKEKALSLHREILDARLGLQGRASYFSLQSQYAYAAICHYLGMLDEAELWMRHSLSKASERGNKSFWPDAAVARTKYHLSLVLMAKARDEQLAEEAKRLATEAKDVLSKLLPYDPGPITGVRDEDTIALFDHLQPVFVGRFTSLSLLKYVGESNKERVES